MRLVLKTSGSPRKGNNRPKVTDRKKPDHYFAVIFA